MDKLAFDVLAKFKRKKKLENGTVVYEYSEKQVAERNRKKSQRYENLRKRIKHLRSQVKRDLNSDDEVKALTALAVGLIDHTYERVGSPASAKGDLNEDGEPHFGVTTWTKKHVSFGKGGAKIKYVGKSGVDHVKKVTDAGLVKALRRAYKCTSKDGDCIFKHEKGVIGGQQVNDYLSTFKVSAKDLRGFHANREMKERLAAIRSKGGALPEDKKDREKKLKDEFKKALEQTAEAVGHEASTLRTQYLIPGLEDGYLKDGTVTEKMGKQATVQREAWEIAYPPEDLPEGKYERPLAREAAIVTLDEPWVDKMRKDFLTLLKNVSRLKDYDDAVTLSQAIHTYADRFKELFFDHFLNTSLKYLEKSLNEQDKNYIDKKLRKSGWDFYIELSLPFSRADEYYSKESRFAKFKEEAKRWENRIKSKARTFWTDMRETIEWYERIRFKMKDDPEKIQVETPDVDQVSMEGFRMEIRGYDPTVSYMPEALEHIKYALKEYRSKAKQRLPLLLQKQIPMVIDFQASLDIGGQYEGKIIRINATSALGGKDPNVLVKTLAHEMGHHLFKTWLSAEATALWYTLIRGDYGDIDLKNVLLQWPESVMWASDFSDSIREKDPILSLQVATVAEGYQPGGMMGRGFDKREDFERMLDSGVTELRVPSTPITGYAGKNHEEAFCETIGLLVAYGPRAVHEKIRSWLDVILPGQVKLAKVFTQYVPPGVYCRA